MAEPIQLNLWSVFYAGVSVQGFFITGILLAVKKGNRIANRLLALLMLLLTKLPSIVFSKNIPARRLRNSLPPINRRSLYNDTFGGTAQLAQIGKD